MAVQVLKERLTLMGMEYTIHKTFVQIQILSLQLMMTDVLYLRKIAIMMA